MAELCKLGGILNPKLTQAQKSASDKRTSCKPTGRPLNSKKVLCSKILSEFKKHRQLDFMFVKEFENAPILYMLDVATRFSVTRMLLRREVECITQACAIYWVNIRGSPSNVSGDPEFENKEFK